MVFYHLSNVNRFKVRIYHFPLEFLKVFNNFQPFRVLSSVSPMKRTRNATKSKDDIKNDERETKSEHFEDFQTIEAKSLENAKLNDPLEFLGNQNETTEISSDSPAESDKNFVQNAKNKLNLTSLRDRKNVNEELKLNFLPPTNKLRAVVDLKMMKEELKQLEDPPSTAWERNVSAKRLPLSFFDAPCEELAQNLLGKILVRCLENGTILKGRIVETEGYLGVIDKASHTYQNKVTPRNMPMYMLPGTIYVYMTYGMYHCFNISSQGEGCAVLIRAVEPLEGVETMTALRTARGESKTKKPSKELKAHELCNGPSKLCIAFQLTKGHSKYSLCSWKGLWIEDGETIEDVQIVKCARIGIENYGEEWSKKSLRYYVHGNKFVSKRNRKAEASMGLN